MRKISFVLAAAFLSAPVAAHALDLSGFDTPESAQTDPETGAYYISNINGDPSAKDGNGYISKVTSSGNTVIQRFIGGRPEHAVLNAPKGLAIAGELVYVADIDAIKGFNKRSGKLEVTVDLTPWNVKDLNDLALDAIGALYVSDRPTNRIFKVHPRQGHEAALFIDSPALGGPNGLVINPRNRNLMVVTWDSGQILEIDPSGKVHRLKRGLRKLDGIDYDAEGNLYVSSYEKGEIYRIPFHGRGLLTTFLSGLSTPGDISCDRNKGELLVPSTKDHTLNTYFFVVKKRSADDAQKRLLGKGDQWIGIDTKKYDRGKKNYTYKTRR